MSDGNQVEIVSIELTRVDHVIGGEPIAVEHVVSEMGGGGTSSGAGLIFTQSDVVLGRSTAGAGYGEEIPANAFGRSVLAAVVVAGSLLFAASASAIGTDSANLFWDDTNKRLGIGTNAPIGPLQCLPAGQTSVSNSAMIATTETYSLGAITTVTGKNFTTLHIQGPSGAVLCLWNNSTTPGAQVGGIKFCSAVRSTTSENTAYIFAIVGRELDGTSTSAGVYQLWMRDVPTNTVIQRFQVSPYGNTILRAEGVYGFAAGALDSFTYTAMDTALGRNAAGVLEINNGTAGTIRDLKLRNLISTEYIEGTEMTAPAAPAANGYRLFAQDNGAGKTQLMALFASGVAQQVAIEP